MDLRVTGHPPQQDASGAVEDGAMRLGQLVLQTDLEPHRLSESLSTLLSHSLGNCIHVHVHVWVCDTLACVGSGTLYMYMYSSTDQIWLIFSWAGCR